MGVVTVSSSVSRSPLGLSARFSSSAQSGPRRPMILAFKTDKTQNTVLAAPHDTIPLPIETSEEHKRVRRSAKRVNRIVKAVCTDNVFTPSTLAEVDYNEAAAKLENLYHLSSDISTVSDVEDTKSLVKRSRSRRKKVSEAEQKVEKNTKKNVVGNGQKKSQRLQLDKRIELSKSGVVGSVKRRKEATSEDQRIERLVRDYLVSNDLVSLDWKKIKIPPVLPSSEHTWLFKLMQPMKAISKVKEHLISSLEREPTESEIAEAINMTVPEVREQMEVGRAARNKLIKHNLRLVLFVINKYFQELGNGPRFHDLCQAGVKGLITAIDRFEPNRKFRLSTYGLFWIRHAITRSITVYSFTRVSFGLESVRMEIQKAKLELESQLNRMPTEEEIIKKVGISPERYREVMGAAKPVYSLNAKHPTTQEELIGAIADVDGAGGDNGRQPALLRLALDDVLDSLKPKESLVIRQRYGLDGKGERTLGEIAGNLNISREMVRKYEVKALMKLKHPARVDYLRRYLL